MSEPSIYELRYIYTTKSHPTTGCTNKNYGVFYLSHKKDVDLIVGAPSSNKNWRKKWFWVDGVWQSSNGAHLLGASDKVFNRLQARIKWPNVKLTPQQESNLTLATSILEWCRFWSNLTSELALYNAGLEPTRPQGSFDISLAFRDGAKIPDSLRHGTSSMIDYGVGGSVGHELVIDEAVSLCSIEGDSVTLTDSFDFGSRNEGRLLFMGHNLQTFVACFP